MNYAHPFHIAILRTHIHTQKGIFFLSDSGRNKTRTCSWQVSWDPNNVEQYHKLKHKPPAHVEIGKNNTEPSNPIKNKSQMKHFKLCRSTKTRPCWRSDNEPHCIAVKYCLQYWLHFWVLEVHVNTETESIDLHLATSILQLCSDVALQTLKKPEVYY